MRPIFKYIACLFLLSVAFAGRGQHRAVFEHFTTQDGLTRSYIKCILQDEKGFLWIGTSDGLNRYDGYGFTAYRNKPGEDHSISGNEINAILQDSQHQIWVGTNGGGLNKYLPGEDGFSNYTTQNSNLKNNLILSLAEDSMDRLWIGTNEGLSCFNPEAGLFVNYDRTTAAINSILEDSQGRIWVATTTGLGLVDPKQRKIHFPPAGSSGSYSITSIIEDHKGRLWLGTSFHGVIVVVAGKGGYIHRVRHFTHDSRDEGSLGSNMTLTLFKDHSNVIWIGTDLGGLNRFDETTGKFIRYKNDNRVESSISSNNILAIEEDHLGNLWIGTNFGGLNFLDKDKVFEHFKSNPYQYMSNPVLSIYVDDTKNLWMGTDGNGLSCITPAGKFLQYTSGSGPNSIGGNTIQKIYEDSKGNLWCGTYSQGISVLQKNGIFKHYTSENGSGLSNNDVRAIFTDSRGNLWVGTNGGGLNLLEKEKNTFKVYRKRKSSMHSLSSDSIVCLYEDSRGLIWVGTVHGSVCYFDPDTGNKKEEIDFHQISLPVEDGEKLYGNSVISITEDNDGNMWFGNYVSGLTKMTFHTRTLKQYDESNGLPGNTINGLLPGEGASVWISTNQGLARYYSKTDTFIVYNELDGLQGNEFMHGSFYKSPGGKLYFGGINGVNAFYPDSIKTNRYIPDIVITGIEVFNEPMPDEKPSSLHIKSVRKGGITLDYNQSNFSFSFVALSFPFAQNNQYAVKLEGFENQWRDIGTARSYTYNNIPPGDYIFRVRGSNNDGVWNNEGAAVMVKILPPWWQSGWAYLGYVIIFGSIIFLAFSLTVKRAQLSERLRLVEKEKEYEHRVYQSKLDFFTNISHEFRTPLTLLLSPLEKIVKTVEDPFRGEHMLMHKNARSLLRLVDQVLDFRKVTDGALTLKAGPVDLIGYVRGVYDMFRELSTQKHVHFSFNSEVPYLTAYVDTDKMEKVIYNLLSNAFKFTPAYGKIDIRISVQKGQTAEVLAGKHELPDSLRHGFVEIAVTDNGKGIPSEELSNIFKRFYQVEEKGQAAVGTGIGLSLVKELVNLHHGSVLALSTPGKGSTFTVYLPLDIRSFRQHEINDPAGNNAAEPAIIHEPVFRESPKMPAFPEKGAPSTKPLILIVEDNADVRYLLRTNLENSFRIKEADNGSTALSIALEEQPVLVVSDVTMPVMNGYELCKILKNNIQTSHIPIVLLTARTAMEEQIKGIETGADAYITKPFNLEFLEVRIKKLIENRRKIHRRLLKDGILKPDEVCVTPIDENFLQKVKNILEKHISDPQLKIETLCKEIGMSNTQFYTKVKALTGFSPQEVVKDFRLKRAVQLLKESDHPINEIALSVGFVDARYFSRCFRKQFGTTPSDFMHQYRAPVGGTKG